jgi:hypothetical protein
MLQRRKVRDLTSSRSGANWTWKVRLSEEHGSMDLPSSHLRLPEKSWTSLSSSKRTGGRVRNFSMTPYVVIFRADYDKGVERTENGRGTNAKKEYDGWTCVAIDGLHAASIIGFSSREERLALANERRSSTSCSARKAQLRAPADLGGFARSHNNNNSREDSRAES